MYAYAQFLFYRFNTDLSVDERQCCSCCGECHITRRGVRHPRQKSFMCLGCDLTRLNCSGIVHKRALHKHKNKRAFWQIMTSRLFCAKLISLRGLSIVFIYSKYMLPSGTVNSCLGELSCGSKRADKDNWHFGKLGHLITSYYLFGVFNWPPSSAHPRFKYDELEEAMILLSGYKAINIFAYSRVPFKGGGLIRGVGRTYPYP